MRLFDFILGFERKVRKLRKKWDRLREKTLKKKNPIRRKALERLDAIENNIRALEEQPLTKMNRARLAKQVEINLSEVSGLLKMKPEELKME